MPLVNKPEDSFECILNCSKCSDTGILFASNSQDWDTGPYAFRCDCIYGKGKHVPDLPIHSKWVPEHVDRRPSIQWFHEKFQSGHNLREDSEFVRRQNIWGREYFEYMYKQWQKGGQ